MSRRREQLCGTRIAHSCTLTLVRIHSRRRRQDKPNALVPFCVPPSPPPSTSHRFPLRDSPNSMPGLLGHLGTRLNSDVTSATSPLVIEGVKDGYGQANLACHSVNLEGGNKGKEKEMAPAEHTTAPAHLACLAVDTCCECRPTSTCKTAQWECRKAACVCVLVAAL